LGDIYDIWICHWTQICPQILELADKFEAQLWAYDCTQKRGQCLGLSRFFTGLLS
jgi:hypothetical protein